MEKVLAGSPRHPHTRPSKLGAAAAPAEATTPPGTPTPPLLLHHRVRQRLQRAEDGGRQFLSPLRRRLLRRGDPHREQPEMAETLLPLRADEPAARAPLANRRRGLQAKPHRWSLPRARGNPNPIHQTQRQQPLHRCDSINHIDFKCARAQPQLMSLTVAECSEVTDISAGKLGGLRSLLYTGGFLTSLCLHAKDSLADLCICFGCLGAPPVYNKWFKALPDLSNLTVLTLCTVFLWAVSIMRDAGNDVKLSNLRSLRELRACLE